MDENGVSRAERFMKLLSPLRGPLEATCHKLLWEKGDWEDLLQKVILVAWARFETYQEETSFRSWVFAILFNTAFNDNRAWKRRTEHEEARDPHAFTSYQAIVERQEYGELLADPEGRIRGAAPVLEAALQDLGCLERTAFLLRTLGELKYQEIAETLGIPIGTVMSRLFRARRKLREALLARSARNTGRAGEGA